MILDQFEKQPVIPYTTYQKEQKRKFKNDPTRYRIGNITLMTTTTLIIKEFVLVFIATVNPLISMALSVILKSIVLININYQLN